MEKRAFTRQILHHQAQYSSPQKIPANCIIKDFCKTGLFVGLDEGKTGSEHGLEINDKLFIDFKSLGALQLSYRLHVRVARIVEGALGLEITHNNPEAIHLLYKLAKEPATNQPRTISDNYKHLHNKCKQVIEAFITATHRHLYKKINATLMNRAATATDNAHETAFIDCATRIDKYQDRINSGFRKSLMLQVDNWLNGNPISLPEPMQPEKAAGLMLVEKDEFEDWLLVKVIINKADHHYRATLYDLQLRMSEMTGTEVNYKNNPLSPAYVSHAFYRAISPLQLPRQLMQAVLSAYESQVIVDGLIRLYATLNQLFIDNGILPTIIYKAVKSNTLPAKPIAQTTGAEMGVNDSMLSGSPRLISDKAPASTLPTHPLDSGIDSARTLSAVQNLIALQQQASGTQAAVAAENIPAQTMATDQLISWLTQCQFQTHTLNEQDTTQPLSTRITQWCGEDRQLSEKNHTAVDITEKFFNSMAINQHLSDNIKSVLKQLEIPLLKIFIQDESFFEDVNHPARQVLNRLARLGSHGGKLSQQNTQKVIQTIRNISENFDTDISIFNEASTELDRLITRQETATQRNTERLVKSCDGLETIEKGKYTIRRFIEEQLSGKIVPRVLVELVNYGWRELLVFTLLRDGQASAIWNSYANVVKSLARITPETDLQALHQLGGGLLKIIEIGIKESPGGQQQMKKLQPALIDLLTANNTSSSPDFVVADSLLIPAEDAFSYIDDKMVQNKALSRWVRRARNLQVGSWVEYGNHHEATQMRLAWIGQDHHKFVFVNHQGMKVVELSLREIAEHLQSGHAKTINDPDQPFVDQNLDAMVQDMYNQMSYQATHDELTGLINRKEFERHLGHVLADAKRSQGQHAVCHLDLDQFKVINASCGHEAGDRMLQQVSKLLVSYIQKPHILARLGADEFLFILINHDIQTAKNFAFEIKDAIQELRFDWEDKVYSVSASIGMVAIDEASESISALLNAVDSARLSAKEAGRNRVHIYELNDRDQATRADIMNNIALLNRALDEKRLKLRCQKIKPITDTTLKPHYEILLSVEDNLGIHLAPGEFIHAAERYDRMQAIDRWVIHNVFQWVSENYNKFEKIDCCTINLSGQSLNDETLIDFILDELLSFEIPRDKICFEVTEIAALKILPDTLEMISELKDLGFKFALGGFGAGLSSFSHLKSMPVDYLKIDGLFVKGIANNPADLAMVRSINEMAHLMNKQTIAEYVENAAIEEKLLEIGVDYVQGYHIEKPLALNALFDH